MPSHDHDHARAHDGVALALDSESLLTLDSSTALAYLASAAALFVATNPPLTPHPTRHLPPVTPSFAKALTGKCGATVPL